jgi:hypothetical protein
MKNIKRALSIARATAKNMCYVSFQTVDSRYPKLEPVNFRSKKFAALSQKASSYLDQVKFTWHISSFVIWRNKKGDLNVTECLINPVFDRRIEASQYAKAAAINSVNSDMNPDYILAVGYIMLPLETANETKNFTCAFEKLSVDTSAILDLFNIDGLKTDFEKGDV